MSIEPSDFGSRLRALAELQGAVLTDAELSDVAEHYPQCRGKQHWDVREYAARTGPGAREYRVIRGSSVQDVYRCAERVRAAAVRTALNELEAQEEARQDPRAAASN